MAEKVQTKAVRYKEPDWCPNVAVQEWQVDEKGHHHLVKVGEKSLYDEVQLYKDQCDIKILVDRLMNGDAATIKQLSQPGVYGDVNDFPQEYHPGAGAQALQTLYENQPDEIKEKFPTYELFKKYFTNLTEAMIEEMAKKPEEKKDEVVNNEQ